MREKRMIKESISRNKYILWYGLCALFLGIIDQRRGSASGSVQMIFANLVGVAVFMLLLPSLKKDFFRNRGVKLWCVLSTAALIVFILAVRTHVQHWGLWNTAAVNGVGIATLILYLLWDRKTIFTKQTKSRLGAGFWLLMLSLFLMLLSVNHTVWPGFYLLLFGCFYLIGIPSGLESCFIEGILGGLALWFVGQQCLAFGFRPYDYVRYRGMYLGETQSGLFFMIAFCTFTGLGLYAREKGRKRRWRILCFILAAGCGSLALLAGGKSSLLGIAVGAVTGYLLYDLFMRKSIRHWLLQGVLTGICILALLPAAYGCVRYLPVILHHPIWFEGEYTEDRSVRSFDPWNSERYISFDRALSKNIGRILKVVLPGSETDKTVSDPAASQEPEDSVTTAVPEEAWSAQEDEYAEPGSSREHPYLPDGVKQNSGDGSIDPARVAIWKYFFRHLNWEGHDGDIFYYRSDRPFGNAHNMFLHMAHLYGILPGILFLFCYLWGLIRLIRRKDMAGIVGAMYLAAIMAYGMFEQATTTGQITLSLFFVFYYFGLTRKKAADPQREAEPGRMPDGEV